jgi:hypothetical protein
MCVCVCCIGDRKGWEGAVFICNPHPASRHTLPRTHLSLAPRARPQLCYGATTEQRVLWRLPSASGRDAAGAFRFLATSECFELAGVDDAAEYEATRSAMRAIGLPEEAQDAVFQVGCCACRVVRRLSLRAPSNPPAVEGGCSRLG